LILSKNSKKCLLKVFLFYIFRIFKCELDKLKTFSLVAKALNLFKIVYYAFESVSMSITRRNFLKFTAASLTALAACGLGYIAGLSKEPESPAQPYQTQSDVSTQNIYLDVSFSETQEEALKDSLPQFRAYLDGKNPAGYTPIEDQQTMLQTLQRAKHPDDYWTKLRRSVASETFDEKSIHAFGIKTRHNSKIGFENGFFLYDENTARFLGGIALTVGD
jgi:hypothetical protein